ncbi:MAG: cell wall-binding repeat-containing protein [Desulfitobacteriaceae bacterium]
MGNKKKITFLILFLLVFFTVLPGIAMGETELYKIEFMSDSDSNLILGVTNQINMRLIGDNYDPFSGSVTATITDSSGVETNYAPSAGVGGIYTIKDVILDTPGKYTLTVTEDTYYSYITETIYVLDAKVITSGSLVLNDSNPSHQVTVTLTDSDGKVLPRKAFTVDGTLVGVSNLLNLTTDYNGQVKFSMTPTMLGNVNFVLGDHIIGTRAVQPAYKAGNRIGGTTSGNAALSVEVAKQGWATATNVILTRDDILIDAMTAVPLSKKLDAPILMTSSDRLDEAVLQVIQQLHSNNVYIAGGTVAVTPAVEKSLTDNGLNVIRLAGYDRYETAVKIAQLVGSNGTVYLANGFGEPDALAVSAFAAEQGNPILLTERGRMPDVTLTELQTLAPGIVNIIGGTAVVSSDIENQLKAQYVVQRWGGWDRYGTEQIIFQNLFTNQSPLYFASALVEPNDVRSGKPNGDALVTAALAAKTNGFVVTVPPDVLPSTLDTFLLYNKGYIPVSTVVGNRTSITTNLEQYLQVLLNH